MADNKSDKKTSKLLRKLSRKNGGNPKPDDNDSPSDTSKSATLPSSLTTAKSSTLPSSSEGGAMALHSSPSGGLFSKLKRRFRFGSKGKYDLRADSVNSLSTPPWLRRKSDETQLRHEKSTSDLTEETSNAVAKSSSVKTTRKTKSDKEEVILIRKDKRVSVICKAENGASEVIFSNVDHSDEDSREVWAGIEEDPYATISSVRDEINQKIPKTKKAAKKSEAGPSLPSMVSEPGKAEKTPDDDYPYARIDPNRKKKIPSSRSPPEATGFNMHISAQLRSRIEPDYETLDDVQQRKSEIEMRSNPLIVYPDESCVTDKTQHRKFSGDLDPDYESLDDVKEKCAANALAANKTSKTHPTTDLNSPGFGDAHAISGHMTRVSPDRCSSDFLPATPIPQISLSSGASMQEHKPGQSPSSISSSSLAPLAPSDDSTLLNDPDKSPSSSSPQEQCIYDNPNVILRKQSHRAGADTNSFHGKRSQTVSEPPLIKTPAEEELVEKLSALLAPPLPMRNYQKEEIHPKGDRMTRSCGGIARHSWCSQASRTSEFRETLHNKDNQKSPSNSFTLSRENLRVRESPGAISLKKAREGIDSSLGKSEEILPMLKENNGLEFANNFTGLEGKKIESSSTDKEKKADNMEEKHDVDTVSKLDKVKDVPERRQQSETQSIIEKNVKHPDLLNMEEFSQQLAEKILNESMLQSYCKTPDSDDFRFTDIEGSLEKHPEEKTISIETVKSKADKNKIPNVKQPDGSKSFDVCEFVRDDRPARNVQNLPVGSDEHNGQEGKLFDHIEERSPCLQPKIDREKVNSVTKNQNENFSSSGRDMHSNPSHELPVLDTERTNIMEVYKLQGARPKIKPLHFHPTDSSSRSNETESMQEGISSEAKNSLCQKVTDEVAAKPSLNGRQLSLEDWDDIRSPSFCDIDFHDDVDENIPSHRERPWLSQAGSYHDGEVRKTSESSIQETLYLDTDTDTEDEVSTHGKNGLKVHESKKLNLKRNLLVTLVAKPVVCANGRLVENLIGGRFKTWACLDRNYLRDGVFKWARYFPFLGSDRQAVKAKMQSYLWFVRKYLYITSNRDDQKAQILQRRFDSYQKKMEKHLKAVQDLPTFQDVRMELLKTEELDNWEPEKPKVNESELPPDLPQGHETTDESLMEIFNQLLQDSVTTKGYLDNGREGEKPEAGEEIVENLCEVPSDHPSPGLPGSPTDTVSEFLKLSSLNVRCQTCGEDDTSDSEDEILALNNYTKSVSRTSLLSRNVRTPYFDNASYCRAFHGELAYMACMRKTRSGEKVLLVPGPDDECKGSESHLSWNSWCTADNLFKKLVPHISPRLDFQFLLKTYAEFKCFILKDRKRNYEHKGCYTKTFPPRETKCCRFEEFVFLKILRDELRYFSQVIKHSKASKALFMEERDVGMSLLELLNIVLRNIHKMRKSMSQEIVDSSDDQAVRRFQLINSEFKDCRNHQQDVSNLHVPEDERYFHADNYENFRPDTLSQALKGWKSPQDYLHDPNVLITCRSAFAHTNSRSLEIQGMPGTEELKPLQEREDFLVSMNQLQLKEWYWGPISYEQAAMILRDKEDGSFLVRDSSDQKYLLSLSFKSLGEIHHTRIEHAKGLFSFWSQPESHGKARICEFIEKSVQNSRDGRFLYFLRPSARGTPPLPIRLLMPVSRNFRIATLKHLSRFVVRQTVRKDHIDQLPVPEKVKRYLRDKQYYVEIHDSDLWAFDGDLVKSS